MSRDLDALKVDEAKQGGPDLPAAAQRALAEAAERRLLAEQVAGQQPRELAGRGGADPVRFGDWEVKGLATDF